MRSKVSGMIKVLVITFIVCISFNCQTYAFFLTDNGAVISLDVTSEDVKTVFKQIAMSSGFTKRTSLRKCARKSGSTFGDLSRYFLVEIGMASQVNCRSTAQIPLSWESPLSQVQWS